MDHIMNQRLSDDLGEVKLRIPLQAKPTIRHADALETNWADMLPPEECSYVLGNPPFSGSKEMDAKQRKQVQRIANFGKKKGSLDFVAAWYFLAAQFCKDRDIPIAFVSTNSISQGEQVAELWPQLYQRFNLEIFFAHRTFAWGSEAKGKANVHVVILGVCNQGLAPPNKRLFEYPDIKRDPVETRVRLISPYLFDASKLHNPRTVVPNTKSSPQNLPKMKIGTKPIDGGFYIFTPDEKAAFENMEPQSSDYFVPFIGSDEFISGIDRYLLALKSAQPDQLRRMPRVNGLIENVRDFRLGRIKGKNGRKIKEGSTDGKRLALIPTEFHVSVFPKLPFLVVPETSSENRDYVPIGWAEPPTVPSSLVRIIECPTLDFFGLLTSRMHMSWLRFIGGRLKSDYRYSIGLVYNPFPWPDLDDAKKEKIGRLGQGILDARLKYPQSTLADVYNPLTMPTDLRKAHEANDKAVDQLYRREPFASDRERVEFLLARYEQITAPALALAARKPKRARRAT
jgi:hypothetical protein